MQELSLVDRDDFIYSNCKRKMYKMICGGCNKDRGYQPTKGRFVMCQSCGQKGKKSHRKGIVLGDSTKKAISKASEKCRKNKDSNYKKLNKTDKRIIGNIRSRLWQVLKAKTGSVSSSLGCKTYELRLYLESKFEDWMSWDNYGDRWEIDHIRPLSSFDLTNKEEFAIACHYTNLQPLCKRKNRSKGAKRENN
jgi:hypothetical protein